MPQGQWQRQQLGDMVVYRPVWPPGCQAIMTTRSGGASEPPYDRLNLGFHVGDDAQKVAFNRRQLSQAAGMGEQPWATVDQVHGTAMMDVTTPVPERPLGEADGMITAKTGVPLAVFGADCGILLFFDAGARRIAAAHAGWRGTVQGLSEKVIQQMVAAGSNTGDIWVAIGAVIGPCCYPVGPEVVELFMARWPFASAVLGHEVDHQGKRTLHLARAQQLQCEAAGVPAGQIAMLDRCTCCSPEFFSYRRDGRTGRHGALIWLEEEGGGKRG
ncbi:peptidoglycan editing factor PgeF [Heliophilum fasciatum]|uniref:Purine nucleoside phosphorylase n=1 Tax=Heliophilum fasciatum TaxID=35700 RepID=A0A4R2RHL3_9FIRM|nr:peptidoglycan editing factor PgeF [Heliophilum fasciatum]MCW2278870.1 YfiH family protein [Heliophilum fasciatum]TCP62118.1 hypothetical protein EDD73_12325 [Heliophilum fasciatum]